MNDLTLLNCKTSSNKYFAVLNKNLFFTYRHYLCKIRNFAYINNI